jgi:hypothetical protein
MLDFIDWLWDVALVVLMFAFMVNLIWGAI